jgi:hypothetical protein
MLWVLFGFTCTDEDGECVDYSACEYSTPPSQGRVNFVLSEPLPVLVILHQGATVEHGAVIWSGPPTSKEWSLTLPAGEYSATALYIRNGDTTIAVDGDYAGYETVTTCDGTCYESDDGDLDLAL